MDQTSWTYSILKKKCYCNFLRSDRCQFFFLRFGSGCSGGSDPNPVLFASRVLEPVNLNPGSVNLNTVKRNFEFCTKKSVQLSVVI